MDDDVTSHFSDISIKHETSLDLTTLTTVSDSVNDEMIEIQSNVSMDVDQKPILPLFRENGEKQPNKIDIVEKQPKKVESPPVHRNTGKISIENYRRRRLLSTSTRSRQVAPLDTQVNTTTDVIATHESRSNTNEPNQTNPNLLVLTFTQPTANSNEVIEISDDEIEGAIIGALTKQPDDNQAEESQPAQVEQPNHNGTLTSMPQSAHPPMAKNLQEALQLTPAQNHQQAVQQPLPLPQQQRDRMQPLAVQPENAESYCFICTRQLKNRQTFKKHQKSMTHRIRWNQNWVQLQQLQNNMPQPNNQ